MKIEDHILYLGKEVNFDKGFFYIPRRNLRNLTHEGEDIGYYIISDRIYYSKIVDGTLVTVYFYKVIYNNKLDSIKRNTLNKLIRKFNRRMRLNKLKSLLLQKDLGLPNVRFVVKFKWEGICVDSYKTGEASQWRVNNIKNLVRSDCNDFAFSIVEEEIIKKLMGASKYRKAVRKINNKIRKEVRRHEK